MSTFEKIILPLIDNNLKSIDLTPAAGFIDSYTYDPDNPTWGNEFFLVFDDTVRNDYSKDVAKRLSKSKNIKKKYVKHVDGKPYFIYSFWVKPELNKLYEGVFTLNTKEVFDILQFWGPFDNVSDLVLNPVIQTEVVHQMPLEDMEEDLCGLEIKKEDSLS